MKTIIFKNEKRAKVYEIRAAKSFHIYSEDELVQTVKTDNIDLCTDNFSTNEISVTEIK
jgi:hypothetical protein